MLVHRLYGLDILTVLACRLHGLVILTVLACRLHGLSLILFAGLCLTALLWVVLNRTLSEALNAFLYDYFAHLMAWHFID
ncbi:hypothetical protein ABT131_29005 [Streptomyces sp900105245]|uniref:hypothetical protein n=1 Tax=Streptomyces sp. 900105245 TaxID=3154379 RepID=UPI00333156E6